MEMKTIHTNTGMKGVEEAVLAELRKKGNLKNFMRVISIGSAVVVLPDTDRSKEATQTEVLKAMGLQGVEVKEVERRKFVVTDRCGDRIGIWALTLDQIRFLEELEEQGYLLDDDTKFEDFNDVEAKEI